MDTHSTKAQSKKERKRNYHRYIHSREWKLMRQRVFEIHGRKCRICTATERLEVNHKHYRTIFNEDPATDLEVLCRKCHCRFHGIVYKAKGEGTKSFKKRRKRFSKAFSGGLAMTMEEYRARDTGHSTNACKYYS